MRESIAEEHIGDGIYAAASEHELMLRAGPNVIYLDAQVWGALLAYVERLRRAAT